MAPEKVLDHIRLVIEPKSHGTNKLLQKIKV